MKKHVFAQIMRLLSLGPIFMVKRPKRHAAKLGSLPCTLGEELLDSVAANIIYIDTLYSLNTSELQTSVNFSHSDSRNRLNTPGPGRGPGPGPLFFQALRTDWAELSG